MTEGLIELQRTRDPALAEEVVEILKRAGIRCGVFSTEPAFDLAAIGSGGTGDIVLSVAIEDYEKARAALETEYAANELPEDHHLRDATDEEIIDIVSNAADWNPFDVVHARRLVAERGIDLAAIERERAARLEKLRQGKPGPRILALGWIFTIGGGLLGLAIALSILTLKHRTPEGDFYIYSAEARAAAKRMAWFAAAMSISLAVLRILLRSSPPY